MAHNPHSYIQRLYTWRIATALLLFIATGLYAQPHATPASGTEYWVLFQKNFRDYVRDDETKVFAPAEELSHTIFISAWEPAQGTVEVPGLGISHQFSIPRNGIAIIQVDSATQLRSSEVVENLGVHIVADSPITVYGLSHRYQSTDTYVAYPVDALGTRYRAIGYEWLANDLLSQMAVVATEDNTRVSITPSTATQGGKPKGASFQVTLNKGEVYQIIPKFIPNAPSDLTGSLIESDKPIAVFSGHNCAYVPDKTVKACNILIEQLPPVQAWGTSFIAAPLAQRADYTLRVVASEPGTEVSYNGAIVATLGAGAYYQQSNAAGSVFLQCNKPVMVAQYSKGFSSGGPRGDSVGDPMMLIVPPVEQYTTSALFATPMEGSWNHYVNIIAPKTSIGTIRVDGKPVEEFMFTPVPSTPFYVAHVPVPYGAHTLTSSSGPFGFYNYGFGYEMGAYDAYGNAGGYTRPTPRVR